MEEEEKKDPPAKPADEKPEKTVDEIIAETVASYEQKLADARKKLEAEKAKHAEKIRDILTGKDPAVERKKTADEIAKEIKNNVEQVLNGKMKKGE